MAALKGLPNGLPSVFAMGLPNISAKHQNNAFESLGIKKRSAMTTTIRQTTPLKDSDVKKLEYKGGKFSKYALGGVANLYLFIYKPNLKGSSIKKYKIKINANFHSITDEYNQEMVYPDTSLNKARHKVRILQQELIQKAKESISPNFDKLANEYFKNRSNKIAIKTAEKEQGRYKNYIKETLGDKPINKISYKSIVDLLLNIEAKFTRETAERVKMVINGIFKYSLSLGVIEANPTPTTSVFYNQQRVSKPRSAIIEPEEIKELIRSINTYKNPTVKNALFFTMLTAQRQNQILNLKWSNIEVKNGITFIRFSSEIMKMKRTHLTALSSQALEIIESQKTFRVNEYVFGMANNKGIMSDCTMLQALNDMGYKGKHSTHGFRATFSTIMAENEHKHNLSSELIELCLAHSTTTIKGKVASAYDRSFKLEQQLMAYEWYSNFINDLEPLQIAKFN